MGATLPDFERPTPSAEQWRNRIIDYLRNHGPSSMRQICFGIGGNHATVKKNLEENQDFFVCQRAKTQNNRNYSKAWTLR